PPYGVFRGGERRVLLGPHFTCSIVKQPAPCGASMSCVQAKENRPLFISLGQGGALIPLFRLPRNRGGWRATRRMAWITPDRPGSASLSGEPVSPGSGREASRPAPCGGPTRHLGLLACALGATGA